jgi:ABC-type multidrug transport system permease subunit
VQNNCEHIYFSSRSNSESLLYGMKLLLKQWFRDKGKTAALLLQPFIIGFLFSQIFSASSSLWTVSFAIILCANWFALSLSIREIVQEKEIVRGELRKGQKTIPYYAGKLLLPSIAAFIQTAIVYAFVAYRITVHPSPALLAATFACTVAPAVAMGLLVSSLSKNSGQANAFLPLIIIPQVALAGALVPFDQMQHIGKWLSTIVWSRYNQSSLLNLLLERPDNMRNAISALTLALIFCIITAIILHSSKKAK